MLVSKNIPNLVGGVSQQPDVTRSDNQCEDQINAYPSVVEGLTKRMPTEYQSKIDAATLGTDVFTHFMERDSSERYIFFIDTATRCCVYDIENATDYTVDISNADTTYLTSSTPQTSFKAVTIADVTFLVNTDIAVEKDEVNARPNPPNGNLDADEAIIFIKQGKFGAKYEVNFDDGTDNTPFVYETPDGLVTSPPTETYDATTGEFSGSDFGQTEAEAAATNRIAEVLAGRINTDGDLTAVQIGSSIYVKYTGSASFNITVNDSNGGRDMLLIKDEVQNFSDLPVEARHGFTVLVKGDPEEALDDYYVEFKASNSGDGNGVWLERDKPGNYYRFKEATMPHILVRTFSGSTPVFTLRKADDNTSELYWKYRAVGDDETNPYPTFVGEKIKDVFLFKNRLGFLAGESIVMSRAGQFFDFFRPTVLDILDDQPIDVQAAHNKVALMHDAVPFSDRLILFSDHSQFSLMGDPILTTKTVSITATNDYSNLNSVAPVPSARSIFFGFGRGGFSGVNEYFPTGDGETFKSIDITANVPQYINGNITKFAPCTNENVMVALSSGQTDSIYVYNYFTQDNKRVQNAWHRFEFGSSSVVVDAEFIQSTLFLVIKRGTDYFIEKIRFDANSIDSGSTYFTRLDRRISHAGLSSRTYDSATNLTTMTLPYVKKAGRSIEVITYVGKRIPVTTQTDDSATVVLTGDYSSTDMFLGEAYTMTYQFSDIFIKENTRSGGQTVIPDGRLQLRYGNLIFADSGAFNVAVTNDNSFTQVVDATADPETVTVSYDTDNHKFTGRLLGSSINRLGQVPFESGEFRFPVFAKSDATQIVVTNDSPLPCKLIACEFELSYNPRSRRMNL